MPDLSLDKLKTAASQRIKPFFEDIINAYADRLHSVYVTGSAITDDFDEKISDVNSIFVLNRMDLKFLELLAPLGKHYGKQRVAAPLIMTPDYIATSLDVFPIEFLNFRLIHAAVYGEDILAHLDISRMDLRHQCEREIKAKLVWLRQGYLSSMGDRKILTDGFVSAITGYIPLFRGIVFLLGKEPPLLQEEVISTLSEISGIDTAIFTRVLREKYDKRKHTIDELNTIFEDYYAATEKLGTIVDEIKE